MLDSDSITCSWMRRNAGARSLFQLPLRQSFIFSLGGSRRGRIIMDYDWNTHCPGKFCAAVVNHAPWTCMYMFLQTIHAFEHFTLLTISSSDLSDWLHIIVSPWCALHNLSNVRKVLIQYDTPFKSKPNGKNDCSARRFPVETRVVFVRYVVALSKKKLLLKRKQIRWP